MMRSSRVNVVVVVAVVVPPLRPETHNKCYMIGGR